METKLTRNELELVDVGLSIGNKRTHEDAKKMKEQSSEVQLDLLPLRPLARKATAERDHSVPDLQLISPQLLYRGSDQGELLLGLDVHHRPATGTYANGHVASRNESFTPLSQFEALQRGLLILNRERDAHVMQEQEFDGENDRAFETNSSRAGSDEEEGGNLRKKLRLSKVQSAILEESFKGHSNLNPKQKNSLAKQLNLTPRQVEVWFQNRRARTKLKQTEVDCELLKRYCENLTEENKRLQKELKDLRTFKVSPPCVISHDFRMPLPATTLTMCPSCQRLSDVAKTSKKTSPKRFRQQAQSSAAC